MIMEVIAKLGEDELTATEVTIKEYLIAHPQAIVNLGVKELSEECYVGIASINRFCKKLGYSGYSAFKIDYVKDYKDYERTQIISQNIPFEGETSLDDVIDGMPLLYDKVVGYTKAALNRDSIARIVERLQRSYVMIFGTGVSKLLGEAFAYRLEEIGIMAKVYDSYHYQQVDYMLNANKPMFAIVMTHSGKNASMITVMQKLHDSNVSFALICSKCPDEYASLPCEIIKIIQANKTKQLSNVQFSIAMEYILDVLYAALVVKNMSKLDYVAENSKLKIKETSLL